jgi:hypothetical protein
VGIWGDSEADGASQGSEVRWSTGSGTVEVTFPNIVGIDPYQPLYNATLEGEAINLTGDEWADQENTTYLDQESLTDQSLRFQHTWIIWQHKNDEAMVFPHIPHDVFVWPDSQAADPNRTNTFQITGATAFDSGGDGAPYSWSGHDLETWVPNTLAAPQPGDGLSSAELEALYRENPALRHR